MVNSEVKMKRYWESLPGFRHLRQAEFCAQNIQDYFKVETKVFKQESSDFDYLVNEMLEMMDLSAKVAPSWYIYFETNDKEKEMLIECFIVAWAKGFEDRGIYDITKQLK